jgi:hypothetical protein
MNIIKIILSFFFLLQILFYIGYIYSHNNFLLFSFPFMFDEEFVIMFAMFIVLLLCFIYAFESFSMLFQERIINLNKFFVDNFDQVLVNVNNLIISANKLLTFLQFNLIVLKVINENLFLILSHFENKQNINFLTFLKFSLYKDKFLFDFLNFLRNKI